MLPFAYAETSFLSHVLSRRRSIGRAARSDRLDLRLLLRAVESQYALVYSRLTLHEARKGRYGRIRENYLRTRGALADMPKHTIEVAKALSAACGAPGAQRADMIHLAFAICGGVSLFLTEDHKHIANPDRIQLFETAALAKGFVLPHILTSRGLTMPRNNPRRPNRDRLLDAIHRSRARESRKIGPGFRNFAAFLKRLESDPALA